MLPNPSVPGSDALLERVTIDDEPTLFDAFDRTGFVVDDVTLLTIGAFFWIRSRKPFSPNLFGVLCVAMSCDVGTLPG